MREMWFAEFHDIDKDYAVAGTVLQLYAQIDNTTSNHFTIQYAEPCNCEHIDHFRDERPGSTEHEYGRAKATDKTIEMVGKVCDFCYHNHDIRSYSE